MKNYIYILMMTLLCAGYTSLYAVHPAEKAKKSKKAAAPAEPAQQPAPTFAVMELFTSEGCSNCPPAYDLVKKVMDSATAANAHVYLLDFHVDYWNEQWIDPYSTHYNTERQTRYAHIFRGAGLYTPQLVMNGREEMVGSDKEIVTVTLSEMLQRQPATSLRLGDVNLAAGDSIEIPYTVNALPGEESVVNIALVQHEATTSVLKGENEGKTLTHHNVVRVFKASPLTARKGVIRIAKYDMPQDQRFAIVGYVQKSRSMEIMAADARELQKEVK